jgi:hypothetical protein
LSYFLQGGFLTGQEAAVGFKTPWQQELSEATNGLRVTDKVARRMVKEEQRMRTPRRTLAPGIEVWFVDQADRGVDEPFNHLAGDIATRQLVTAQQYYGVLRNCRKTKQKRSDIA